jgi:hypothetical protein
MSTLQKKKMERVSSFYKMTLIDGCNPRKLYTMSYLISLIINEFIRCFHQFAPPILSTNISQFEWLHVQSSTPEKWSTTEFSSTDFAELLSITEFLSTSEFSATPEILSTSEFPSTAEFTST